MGVQRYVLIFPFFDKMRREGTCKIRSFAFYLRTRECTGHRVIFANTWNKFVPGAFCRQVLTLIMNDILK